MLTNDERRRTAERLWDAFVALGTLAACVGLALLVIVGLLLPLLLVPLCGWGWGWGVFVVLMEGGLLVLVVLSEGD